MNWQLRPARDIGLTPHERLRSLGREAGLAGGLLQAAWRRAVCVELALLHRFEVTGRENLPAEPPFIMIANHCSHLDALALAGALRGAAAIEERRPFGQILVCCARGYSRSAAAAATWLLATGRTTSAEDAVAQIRLVRPHIVLDGAALSAIADAAARA